MLLIPLKIGSRGDQVQNACYFKKKGYAHVLDETEMNESLFIKEIFELKKDSDSIRANMQTSSKNASCIIMDLILSE